MLDRLVGIPVLGITGLLVRHRKLPDRVDRVGIFVSPTIGDTLMTSAVVQDIKHHYPKAHLIYFASHGSLPAARLLPCVDEIIPLKLTSPLKCIRTMRFAALDLLFDFTPWQRLTAFYSAASAAKCRVGFRASGQHRHYHYDILAEHSPDIHELENFRNLVSSAGIAPKSLPRIEVQVTPEIRQERSSRIVVFHPWASGERAALRQWKDENWADLASSLNAPGMLFFVTGSPNEDKQSHDLCNLLASRGLNVSRFASADGLLSLAAMLKDSDLVVSVNTGILHLAAIAGAPTVALNGPTATHRWGPIGPRVLSVEPYGGGGGFLHLGFEFKGNPTDTMDRIRVQDVFEAASMLMSSYVASSHTA